MTRLDLSNLKTASSTNSMFFKAEILFLEKDSGGDSKKESYILLAIFLKFQD